MRRTLLPGLMLLAATASAEPMNLRDPQPRWVSVRFEVSPPDLPLQTDARYTPRLPAWLEPGALPGEVRVTVAGSLVERHLMRDQHPVPGSFSDFVWTFDARDGQVRSATLSGVLRQRLRLGLTDFEVTTPIHALMDTASPAGHARSERLFGRRIFGFCVPTQSRRCQAVVPTPYDPATGYVNALGAVSADAQIARVRSYSPLGEAIFSEAEPRLASDGSPSVSLPPPTASLD